VSVQLILDYITKKQKSLSMSTDSLDILSKQSADKRISDFINQTVGESVWDGIKNGPLGQLGKDFMSEMIAKNGSKIINNVDTAIRKKIGTQVEQMQSLVFDSITAVLTAKNDLAMYFIQQLARQLLTAIQKKQRVTADLRTKLLELYNILVLITTTSPFFDEYLGQLRQALVNIYTARNDLVLVRNTLQANDFWLKLRYKEALDKLRLAEKLMEPDSAVEPDVKFTDKGLLSGVGIPSKPQQLALLLSLPQKIKEVLACANGYFIAVATVNALLLAYTAAYGSFTQSASRKLKEYTINTLDKLIELLDALVSNMATQLNGSPDSILTPINQRVNSLDPNFVEEAREVLASGGNLEQTDLSSAITGSYTRRFSPDPTLTSAFAMGWLIDLKSTLAFANIIPGPTLEALNVSNEALRRYNVSVERIKTFDTISNGDAILVAVDGREEIGQLERQLTTFTIAAAKAVALPQNAKAILPLGRTLLRRMDLVAQRDQEIYTVVAAFAGADLAFPDALKKSGDNIYRMLDKFGLDRAADALRNGNFADFFNMNSKTATYVGAAITGFAVLNNCLNTEEAREQVNQAKRELERDLKSKELIALRSANSGFEQQKEENFVIDNRLEVLKDKTIESSKACGLPQDLAPANLFKNVGPIIGVGVLGNKTLQSSLTKYGRGIL
jgi:hypothetical protein